MKVISVAEVSHLLADAMGITVRAVTLPNDFSWSTVSPCAARSTPPSRLSSRTRARIAASAPANGRDVRVGGHRRDEECGGEDRDRDGTCGAARSRLGDRLDDHVDHALDVGLDEEIVAVHRERDVLALQLALDRRQLLDRPTARVVPDHAVLSQPRSSRGEGEAAGAAGEFPGAPGRIIAEPAPRHLAGTIRMGQAAAVDTGHLAFVCAMPMELGPLARELQLVETEIAGVVVHAGNHEGRPVVAVVTGMGTELAGAGVERLLDAVQIDHVLVVGITGALENETPIGTLVLPDLVVDSATGREHQPTRVGDTQHRGTMWTTDGLTTDLDELAELRARGVVALDMETAAIAHVCDARGVAWSVFRAISDRACDGTVDVEVFELSNQDGTPNHEAITAYVQRYPERIPQLAQMAENSTLATERAAAAAIGACALL